MHLRRRERGSGESGWPRAPDLAATLERHPFLDYRAEERALVAARGAWDVPEDLVLPSGIGLVLGAGVTLRFAEGALLLAEGPLSFRGTAEEPVVLEAQDPERPWSGIVVLAAGPRSEWEQAIVRSTGGARRSGGEQSGGVTFQRSSVTLRRTLFDGTRARNALTVSGADVLLEACEFRGCAAGAFGADSVSGELRNCVIDGVLVPTQDAEDFDPRGKR